jgi:hypothetical protein
MLRPVKRRFSGSLTALLAVSALATVLVSTCAMGASASSGSKVQRLGMATAAIRDKVRSTNPDAVNSVARVTITPDSVQLMMEQDIAANQPYLSWLRSSQGDAVASRAEDAIKAPYLRRIDQMKTLGVDHQDLEVPVVTVWGSMTFSTRSYDVNMGPMDPVSVLFTGNGRPNMVYNDLTSIDPCNTDSQCRPPAFQDDKGIGAQARGYACGSGTQWVLMGNAGEDLQWQPSTRGVMGGGDRCTQGMRVHMRIFGGIANQVFGTWSVGTPHKEAWSESGGKFGHLIQSWNQARDDVASFWRDFAKRPGATGNISSLSWGNGGYYQNVEFDGRGTAIELCPCP